MKTPDLNQLVEILNELRVKCPWDKKQTIHSLRKQTIEELYELTDTIDDEDWKGMREELGDLLLHLLFYAKIAEEKQQFTIQDVVNDISQKLIRRHPHIYGDTVADDVATVKKNWEKIKLEEGKKSTLSGVPRSLPALAKAMSIQQKAAQVGFEWEQAEDVWDKVKEEKKELEEAIVEKTADEKDKEAGDLLFSIINYIRFLKVDPEYALELTNRKFIRRFQQMEAIAQEEGKQLTDLTLGEMDAIWNRIKKM